MRPIQERMLKRRFLFSDRELSITASWPSSSSTPSAQLGRAPRKRKLNKVSMNTHNWVLGVWSIAQLKKLYRLEDALVIY